MGGGPSTVRAPGLTPASVWADMNTASADESRYGVTLTNLDQPLFDGAGATKQLIDPEIATTAFV
jgi:hypothetical protein